MEEPGLTSAPSPSTMEPNGDSIGENKDIPMDTDDASDSEDIPILEIEGFDDDSEETMIMTVEEAQNYILSRVEEYIKEPEVNHLYVLENEIMEDHKKIQQKNEEFNKISKVFEVLCRDQVKFFRHIGEMAKAETKTVGVSVDLPWLPESMGNMDAKREITSSGSNVAAPIKSEASPKPVKKVRTGPIECIDLSSDEDSKDEKAEIKAPVTGTEVKTVAPVTAAISNRAIAPSTVISFPPLKAEQPKHPAPLPPPPLYIGKPSNVPPKPFLKISVESKGIVLQWDMPPRDKTTWKIKTFEIFGYQEKPNVQPSTSLWKKIGTVEYMNLPMSCTLTQFVEGFKYHFSIRAIAPPDISGVFSDAATITFKC